MSGMDDPREILKVVGVECEELDVYADERKRPSVGSGFWADITFMLAATSDDAILALARLVAKYKWQRDDTLDEYAEVVEGEWGLPASERDGGFQKHHVEDLELRWQADNA